MDGIMRVNNGIIPTISFNCRNARLSILSNCLLTPCTPQRSVFRLIITKAVPRNNGLLCLLLIRMIIRSLRRSMGDGFYHVKSRKRSNVIRVIISNFRCIKCGFLARRFAFPMGIRVATPTRMSTLRKAEFRLTQLISLRNTRLTDLISGRNLSKLRLLSKFSEGVGNYLCRKAFTNGRHCLIILVPRNYASTP